MIGVFVRQHNAVELLRRDGALLQAQNDLPRAETAINENLAMVGGNQGTVSRAPAAEHGQAEHGSQDSCEISFCANGNGQVIAKIIVRWPFTDEEARDTVHCGSCHVVGGLRRTLAAPEDNVAAAMVKLS